MWIRQSWVKWYTFHFFYFYLPICAETILWNAPTALTNPNQTKKEEKKKNLKSAMKAAQQAHALCLFAAVAFGFKASDSIFFLSFTSFKQLSQTGNPHSLPHPNPLTLLSHCLHNLLAQRRGPSMGELYVIHDGIILPFSYIFFAQGILAWNEKKKSLVSIWSQAMSCLHTHVQGHTWTHSRRGSTVKRDPGLRPESRVAT